jgi:hypothetical protein
MGPKQEKSQQYLVCPHFVQNGPSEELPTQLFKSRLLQATKVPVNLCQGTRWQQTKYPGHGGISYLPARRRSHSVPPPSWATPSACQNSLSSILFFSFQFCCIFKILKIFYLKKIVKENLSYLNNYTVWTLMLCKLFLNRPFILLNWSFSIYISIDWMIKIV